MIKDIAGYKPKGSKLTPIEYIGDSIWKCKCDCGNYVNVKTSRILNLHTKSCGCYRKENSSKLGKALKGNEKLKTLNTVHGCEPRKLHNSWQAMKNRCNNPHNNRYHCYGGRGIQVCEEWSEFTPFRDWALANGWKEGLTIDRIDSEKDYEPSNCRWSTQKEQQNNRRDTIMYTYNEITKSLHYWCEEYNLPYHRVVQRIKKLGWSFEKAMGFSEE